MEFSLLINGRSYRLPEGIHVIGRDRDCDIVLDERGVSSSHCRFTVTNGELFVEDLGSRNGTRVAGRRIGERTRLEAGTALLIADLSCAIIAAAPAVAPAPPQSASAPGRTARRGRSGPRVPGWAVAGMVVAVIGIAWPALRGDLRLAEAQDRLTQAEEECTWVAGRLPEADQTAVQAKLAACKALQGAVAALPAGPLGKAQGPGRPYKRFGGGPVPACGRTGHGGGLGRPDRPGRWRQRGDRAHG
ncbi:MAG: FHA domain-containing protein [Planctomycetota bacterium]